MVNTIVLAMMYWMNKKTWLVLLETIRHVIWWIYVSCDAKVSVCEIRSVDQVTQDHLTCGYEENQKEVEVEITENKVSILMLFKDWRQQENISSSLIWRIY